MSGIDGGRPGDGRPDLDLDLDLPAAEDAQVTALFRNGLRVTDRPTPDLRTIERRARKRHRRGQAVASGVVATAAALAVLLVVSPWSAAGGRHGVPSTPSPSVTAPLTVPKVTKASLMRPDDLLQPEDGGPPLLGGSTFAAADPLEDLSGKKVHLSVCGDDRVLDVERPDAGFQQIWVSQENATVPAWAVTEQVLQWPGRPEQASAVRDQVRAQLEGCWLEKDGRSGTAMVSLGDVNLPLLQTFATDQQGLELATAVLVVGDAVIVLKVASASGSTSSKVSLNTFFFLFPAATRLVGDDPGSGDPSPLRYQYGSEKGEGQ
jgi:hypothetical protein